MAEHRIIVLPEDLVNRIDKIRGSSSRSDFVTRLIEETFSDTLENQAFAAEDDLRILREQLSEFSKTFPENCVTQEQLTRFKQNMKELMRSFIDFFITYGLKEDSQERISEINILIRDLKS